MKQLDLNTALRQHFGYSSFRVGQREAIEHALAQRDALVVMPTGSGKSLCYQLPALMLNGTTIVISPLIALMKDQVDALTASNKAATFINSTLTTQEQKARLLKLARGEYKIVYIAPERLRNAEFLCALTQTRVGLLAVDEAHCISQWGHDFRPDYQHIRDFIPRIGKPPILALTATATPNVQADITKQLGLACAEKIVTGFNRPNIRFTVRYTPSEADKLRELQSQVTAGGNGIVYAGTRREAEEVSEFINEVVRLRTAHYHAGLDDETRAQTQDDFMRGALPVIVATNAFGMGVDKPDIRFVVHYSLTATVEAYYQEVGRAGRDGKSAQGVLLYSPQDRALQEWFIENDAPTHEQTSALYRALPRGTSRIFPPDLQRETGMNDTKLQVALRQLESAGALERLGDVHGTMLVKVEALARLDLSASEKEIERLRQSKREKLSQMIRYAESNACRRRFILDYFGDPSSADASDCCDNHFVKATEPSNRAESDSESIPLVILETVSTLPRGIGREKLAMIVKGSRAHDMFQFGYHRHKFYGKFSNLTLKKLGAIIEQMIVQDYLKVIGGEYPVLQLTPHGQQAINTRAAIKLNPRDESTKSRYSQGSRTVPIDDVGSVALTILECLHTIDRQLFPTGVTRILTGSDAKGYARFAKNPFYGRLEQFHRKQLDAIMKQLIEKEYVEQFGGVVGLTSLGKSAIESRTSIPIDVEAIYVVSSPAEGRSIVPLQTNKERAHKIWLLGESHSKEDFAKLIQAIDDTNGNVRRLAASALGKIKDAEAIGPLMELLTDTKPQVRQYAIKALGEIGHPAATQALVKIKDDPDEKDYNRTSAVTALRKISQNRNFVGRTASPLPVPASIEDDINRFLSASRPKPLCGPWSVGFALDFNSRFVGARWERTELGELAYRFKYAGESAVAEKIAARLAEFIRSHAELHFNLIIPVPSTKKDRPYDPVPLLARTLADQIGVAVSENALVKARVTGMQKDMTNLAQKQSNVRGAFQIADANATRGKRILLLDDFYDSGSTLAEATRVLLAAGTAEVCVLTVTKTIHAD